MHEADRWVQLTARAKGSQRHSEHRELNQAPTSATPKPKRTPVIFANSGFLVQSIKP
jgi:hypothetical protein